MFLPLLNSDVPEGFVDQLAFKLFVIPALIGQLCSIERCPGVLPRRSTAVEMRRVAGRDDVTT